MSVHQDHQRLGRNPTQPPPRRNVERCEHRRAPTHCPDCREEARIQRITELAQALNVNRRLLEEVLREAAAALPLRLRAKIQNVLKERAL